MPEGGQVKQGAGCESRWQELADIDDGTIEVSHPDNDGQKDPAAVALGRKGGLKGGLARAAALTPERRSEIARQAAHTRWSKSVEP